MTKQKINDKGFTIIEVLIVLAIAGLIMLIVFLAVPALQRNQRNNARNTEGARISALVTECLANRNGLNAQCTSDAALGITPATANRELTAISYSNVQATAPSPAASTTTAGVWHQNICTAAGDGATAAGATSRDFAVIFTLEPAITRCIGSR